MNNEAPSMINIRLSQLIEHSAAAMYYGKIQAELTRFSSMPICNYDELRAQALSCPIIVTTRSSRKSLASDKFIFLSGRITLEMWLAFENDPSKNQATPIELPVIYYPKASKEIQNQLAYFETFLRPFSCHISNDYLAYLYHEHNEIPDIMRPISEGAGTELYGTQAKFLQHGRLARNTLHRHRKSLKKPSVGTETRFEGAEVEAQLHTSFQYLNGPIIDGGL